MHTLEVGTEYEDNMYADSGTGSGITRSAASVYDWGVNTGFSRVHNRVPTLYVQDAWQASRRLRVSAGVRWEAQYLTGDVGPARTIASEIAPRFGIVYQPGELGSQRLFASAGRFYEQIAPLALIFWNSTGVQLSRAFPQNPLVDSANGVDNSPPIDFGAVPATADLVGHSYDQSVFGTKAGGDTFKIGVHGTYRVLRWVLEDGIPPGDSGYRMEPPGVARSRPCRARDNAMRRWNFPSSDRPQGRCTCWPRTCCRAMWATRPDLFATDAMFGWPNSGPQYDYPDLMNNAYGPLPNDRTHVAKAAASYRLDSAPRSADSSRWHRGRHSASMAARTRTRGTGRSCVHAARRVGPPPAGRSTCTVLMIYPSVGMAGSAPDCCWMSSMSAARDGRCSTTSVTTSTTPKLK